MHVLVREQAPLDTVQKHRYNKVVECAGAATVPDQTTILKKDVIIDGMSKSTIFSSMDLMDGIYQILIRK